MAEQGIGNIPNFEKKPDDATPGIGDVPSFDKTSDGTFSEPQNGLGLGDVPSIDNLLPKHDFANFLEDIDEQAMVAFFRGADPSLTREEMVALWGDAWEYIKHKLEQRRRDEGEEQ